LLRSSGMLPVIMEWLILLLLVPAIVVPVVLFFGFAGCSFEAPPPPSLFINSIEPTALKTLTVKWTDLDPHGTGFEIRRTNPDKTHTQRNVGQSIREITDDGLEPAAQYRYRVRRITPLDEPPAAEVTGTTLGPAFMQPLPQSAEGLQGFTFVQRIEPLRLFAGGDRVAITIRSASAVSMKIAKIYISQAAVPDPLNQTPDPYDSATDLTKVVDDPMNPIFVPLGTATTLPVIDYRLDPFKPLLVAFEFANATEEGGNFGRFTGVSASEATVYRSPPLLSEAHKTDRQTGYTPIDNIYLIERIDVAEVPG
jgi:hypothetical protein